ncbi:chorismate synthase [bacterium]|nr:chorismate synthase [bacterium]
MKYLTSGESHGKCLNAIIEGLPSGFEIKEEFINDELKKRQVGYGRGGRMQIESDTVEIKSGVRFGKTTGSPICLEIKNRDFENWFNVMSTTPVDLNNEEIKNQIAEKIITKPRPGHADLTGALKYNFDDIRNVLERSSARETATRTAIGAIAQQILKEFDIKGLSHVIEIGGVEAKQLSFEEIENNCDNDLLCADLDAYQKMVERIDKAKENGDTLGGKVQVIFKNLPVGLGSFTHWDRKLDGLLAQGVMSVQAIKSVEFGLGNQYASTSGANAHDEIYYQNAFKRYTNNAGGIEGGMTNGEDLIITATMKAIPTMKAPLKSVDINSKEVFDAHFERSDTCAVSACSVVVKNVVATILLDAFLEKFGGDSFEEIKANYRNYQEMVQKR